MVLSKPPGPQALNPNRTDQKEPSNINIWWKFWLERTIRDTSKRLDAAQQRYKEIYDGSLRRETKTCHPGDYVCIRRELETPNESHHKLAEVAN